MYRVYDDRKKEESLFEGTFTQALMLMHQHYIDTVISEHIWLEEMEGLEND